jgi:hypothetical protein
MGGGGWRREGQGTRRRGGQGKGREGKGREEGVGNGPSYLPSFSSPLLDFDYYIQEAIQI